MGNRVSHGWNSGAGHGRLQTSDVQAKSSTDFPTLAASGSDMVMPVALAVGNVILGLALTCLLRHRKDQDKALG